MRIPITSYTFDPTAKTITLTKYSSSKPFDLRSLHNITDTTTGQVLYTLYNSGLSTATLSNGNVITLDKLPSGVQASDSLSISMETGASSSSSAVDLSSISSDIVPSADITYSLGSSLTSRFKYAYAQRLWMNTNSYIQSTSSGNIYVANNMGASGVLSSDVGIRVGPGLSDQSGTALASYQNSMIGINTNVLFGLKQFAGSSADMIRFLSSGGATLAKVDSAGNITGTNLSGTNTGDQTATTIANTPAGNIAATNIQAAINELDSEKANNTGNETWAGVKTFSSSPIVPTPTSGTQAVNKAYADALSVAGAPDATTSAKGLVQLAGDLGGAGSTAAAPKVNFANDTSHILKAGDTLADGTNFALGTTTGTMIGTGTTQKLGFYGVTPVAQAGAATDLGTVLSNLGLRPSSTGYTLSSNAQVQFTGPLRTSQSSLTAAGTLTAGTSLWTQLCDASTGAFTVTLAATANKGYRFTIKNIGATGTVTVSAGAGTIDGATTYALTAQWQFVTVESSGTSGVWYIVGKG